MFTGMAHFTAIESKGEGASADEAGFGFVGHRESASACYSGNRVVKSAGEGGAGDRPAGVDVSTQIPEMQLNSNGLPHARPSHRPEIGAYGGVSAEEE